MAIVHFLSSDQKINYAISCVKSSVFAEIEEKLYQEFPKYRNTNNYFMDNAEPVLRFKTIEENKIGNGKVILFIHGVDDK